MSNFACFVKIKIQLSRDEPVVCILMDTKNLNEWGPGNGIGKIYWLLKGYESRNQVNKFQPAEKVSVPFS